MAFFDPYAPDFVDNPYPTYLRLRREAPVFFDETWGLTFFARHSDVTSILKDRRFGRDVRHAVPADEIDQEVFERIYPPQYPTWTAMTRDSFIDLEPPRHTRIRRLVQWAFTRRASEAYRQRLEATARRALKPAISDGGMEAIAEYATPIPLTMISDLLGIPEIDQPQLVEWSHAMVRPFDEACTPQEGLAAEEATKAFVEYVRSLLGDRRRSPGEDLITHLLAAEIEGDRLTDDELIATAILTLNAGHEATVQAIGNSLLALARHPEEFASLRSGLPSTAIDELLRFDTPLQMFERWVLEDLDWNGVALRRGSKVGLLFGSANHDEDVFSRPESLDLRRETNPHVSFGGGIHYCVGAPLAKVEMEVAVEVFARGVASFGMVGEDLPRTPSLVFRGVQELALELHA